MSLVFERDGAVARLVLNRPDQGNSFNEELGQALLEAAIACDEDEGIRCVVLAGRGRMFCAGGDIQGFLANTERIGAYLKGLTHVVHGALIRLLRMNKPLVTSIHGPAAGAGLCLAALGDIALAARSAHFTAAYTAIGLSPDGASTWVLPRLIGMRRTQELMLLNRRVPAEEAAAMGLITRVVDDAALEAETAQVAATLAGSATQALGRTRNLLLSSFSSGLEEQMEAEARTIAACGAGPEGREGVAAFVGKRKPSFSGRTGD